MVLAQRKSASWRLFSPKHRHADGRLGNTAPTVGEQRHSIIVTLAAMLGESAHPAAVFSFLTVLPMVVTHAAFCGALFHAGRLPGGWDAVDKTPVAALLKHWKTVVAHSTQRYEPTFSGYSFYLVSGRSNSHHQDTNRLIRAWQKPELVRDLRMFLDGGGETRDIVLPATTSFERNNLTMTGDYSNQHLVPMKQVVPPRYEARNDFDVFAKLSERWEKGGYAPLRKERVSCNG
ncbi:molybdopterin-dependent oxidoreductase [Shigella flexneri]